ncbi:MAG: CPBP family intramembrane metalloprotease [Lachnospiraceae bacterium]|nr:CPBP family intramembrane metalloprotease [Lachnospiraceae bacterium]
MHNGLSDFVSGLFDKGIINSITAVMSYVYLIISDSVGALVLWLLTRKKAQKPEKHNMKFSWWLVCFMCCFGIGGIGSVIGAIVNGIVTLPSTMLTTLFSFISPLTGQNVVQNLIYKDNSWAYLFMGIIAVGIVVPFLEELIFRKLLIDGTSKYGYAAGILLSGLTFGLFHGNFVQFFYATALGILFAYIYAATGKLRYSALLHMGYNLYASAVIPLARKLIPQNALDEIQKAYALFYNNVTNQTMDSLRALEKFYDTMGRIISKYPTVVLGSFAVIVVYLFYILLILIGIIMIIVFMKKALEFRKTMMLGQKGTKPCALFNWASILLWVMLGLIFVLYYGLLFIASLMHLFK